jgi:hypothetical protein
MKRAALLLAVLMLAPSAFAQPPPPQAPPKEAPPSAEAVADAAHLTDLARAAYKAKRWHEAAGLYESAGFLGRSASPHISAGVAWEQADRPERAADAYARALAIEPNGADAARAKDRLDALEKGLGTAQITAPAGWTVQLDGAAESLAPARLHGIQGVHTLVASSRERQVTRKDVRLEVGKVLTVALKDEAPAPTPTAAAPEAKAAPAAAPVAAAPTAPTERVVTVERPPNVRRLLGFGVAGLGLATLGAAAVLGIETVDARNAFNANPSQHGYDHEQALQTWTNVAIVAGAVLTVGGVVLIVWPSGGSGEARVGIAPTPGGGAVVGRF